MTAPPPCGYCGSGAACPRCGGAAVRAELAAVTAELERLRALLGEALPVVQDVAVDALPGSLVAEDTADLAARIDAALGGG